ncbi:uncharacterized protein DUF4880 [Novosphingobium sp. PhB57]|uniref:FecR/PupR family sigma factor regulator n=1 Tax=Novosphingobium sp. PhB57 TaxID=2485107 RepID=UPI00104A90DA|nr:DUF4880 domain-containing protein [Novosphingobium sp. PhB57]TCU57800.1 uncharacterized protein DUF4880 [Novosphingobium sp. PhB57]
MDPTPPAESIITPAIREEAARLFGERSAGAMTGKDEGDLSVWLNQDSRHAQAYADMERIWTVIDCSTMPPAPAADDPAPLPKMRPSTTGGIREGKQKPASTHHRRGRKSLGRTALAACLLIAVFAQSGAIFTRLRADAVTGVGVQRNVTLPDGSRHFSIPTAPSPSTMTLGGRSVCCGEKLLSLWPRPPANLSSSPWETARLRRSVPASSSAWQARVAVTEHSVRVHDTETPGTTAACVATMGLDWIKPFKALLALERELPQLRRASDHVGGIAGILYKIRKFRFSLSSA